MEVLQQLQEGFFTDGRYRKLGRFKNQIIWTACFCHFWSPLF